MTRCIQHFPEKPLLRRDCAIYHVNDAIDLEVVYI